jgi:hypothetical protein
MAEVEIKEPGKPTPHWEQGLDTLVGTDVAGRIDESGVGWAWAGALMGLLLFEVDLVATVERVAKVSIKEPGKLELGPGRKNS